MQFHFHTTIQYKVNFAFTGLSDKDKKLLVFLLPFHLRYFLCKLILRKLYMYYFGKYLHNDWVIFTQPPRYKFIQQSKLPRLGVLFGHWPKGGLMGPLLPNTPQQTLSSPRYARQDRTETWEDQVDLYSEQRFLQYFPFICGITFQVCNFSGKFLSFTRVSSLICHSLVCPYCKDLPMTILKQGTPNDILKKGKTT